MENPATRGPRKAYKMIPSNPSLLPPSPTIRFPFDPKRSPHRDLIPCFGKGFRGPPSSPHPWRSPHPLTNRTIDAIFKANWISEGGSLSLPPFTP